MAIARPAMMNPMVAPLLTPPVGWEVLAPARLLHELFLETALKPQVAKVKLPEAVGAAGSEGQKTAVLKLTPVVKKEPPKMPMKLKAGTAEHHAAAKPREIGEAPPDHESATVERQVKLLIPTPPVLDPPVAKCLHGQTWKPSSPKSETVCQPGACT